MVEKKSIGTSKDDRTRNWLFVLYPESAPADWRDILDEQHIQWCESPLHDKDVNATGEQKKVHKHILLLFEGKKSYNQVAELTKSLNSTIPIKCQSTKGTIRYFAHLDNPEKAQYSTADIIGHGGFDPAEYLKATASSRYSAIKEMLAFIDKYSITEFWELYSYAAENRFDDWFPLLSDNSAYVVGTYIKSRRHSLDALRRSEALREASSLQNADGLPSDK